MKNIFGLALLVFVLGLAFTIGNRLPIAPATIIIGAGILLLASIPAGILIFAAFQSPRVIYHQHAHYIERPQPPAYPQIVMHDTPESQWSEIIDHDYPRLTG